MTTLRLMSAPADATRMQRIERGANFLRTEVLPYRTQDLTWEELQAILNQGKMSGWLSDVGSFFNSGIRDASSAVGLKSVGGSVTNFLDDVGHSLGDKLASDVQGDAKASILDALGSFGDDIKTGHFVNSVFTPVGLLIIVVVVYFVFIRKGKKA